MRFQLVILVLFPAIQLVGGDRSSSPQLQSSNRPNVLGIEIAAMFCVARALRKKIGRPVVGSVPLLAR
jgi:hypothetical protein